MFFLVFAVYKLSLAQHNLYVWCWRRLLRVPWAARIFIKRTDAETEALILWPPHAKSWLIGKDLDAGRDWGQEEKGRTEDEMVGWHH